MITFKNLKKSINLIALGFVLGGFLGISYLPIANAADQTGETECKECEKIANTNNPDLKKPEITSIEEAKEVLFQESKAQGANKQ